MIIERIGDLLESKEVGVLLHICNLQGIWGGGIVIPIKKKYPEAYDADLKTQKGDVSKLGTYSFADVRNNKEAKAHNLGYIVNCYFMKTMGKPENNISYDAMYDGMLKLKNQIDKKRGEDEKFKDLTVGMASAIGQGLAGGSPKIIRAIIDEVWEASPIITYLYKLPDNP